MTPATRAAPTQAPALRTHQLGKRYGRTWGLRDCTLAVPAGAVVGLVGPNGAGKSTLLQLVIGLLDPTEGHVQVFGQTSRAHRAVTLGRVSYVAQDHPLYRDFSVADMFHLGRAMNPAWDQRLADQRMASLGIPLKRKVKALSGGQQAQVALAMALAKRAPLLVLDEPVASLDPVARLEFMGGLMAAVADRELTAIISSHVVTELERVCDWVIVLSGGAVRAAGPVDDLIAAHRLLTGPRTAPHDGVPGVIHRADSHRHSTLVVRIGPGDPAMHPAWQAQPVGFEQLVLAYLQGHSAPLPGQDPHVERPVVPVPGTVAR
jgi:ABC-2 type transport system ATP-binding protein